MSTRRRTANFASMRQQITDSVPALDPQIVAELLTD